MSAGGFEYVLRLCLFMVAVWMAGRLMKFCKISPLLGQLLVGVILGPHALDLVPYATETYLFPYNPPSHNTHHDANITSHNTTYDSHNTSVTSDSHHDPHPIPSILVLAGQLGVILMILESGLHIDFETLKDVGVRACMVAVLGTVLPLVCGLGFAQGLGYPFLSCLAIGVALAPTSVGIALKLLTETKQLDTTFGQTIVTAAFVDDVLSLLSLVVLMSLHKGTVTAATLLLPIVGSLAFVLAGCVVALKVAPVVANWISKKIERVGTHSIEPRDEVFLVLMFLILSIDAVIAEQIGSHLLGAFVAGITFSRVPRAMMIWKRQVKRIVHWLVRLFFASTVAFSIPVRSMISLESFGFGILLTLIAITTKILAGIPLKQDRLLVGSAMVPRGEFAYLIAQRCYTSGIIDVDLFSILIWALVLATVIAPFGFKCNLMKKLQNKQVSNFSGFQIHISGHHHSGVLREICQILHEDAFDIIQARMESDGEVDVEVFIVAPRGRKQVDIDPATLKHFEHHLKEVLDDPQAQVEITPLTKQDLDGIEGRLPEERGGSTGFGQLEQNAPSSGVLIKLMVDHKEGIFGLIKIKLNELDLVIRTVNIETIGGKRDCDEIYVQSKNGKTLDQITREKIRDQLTNIFRQKNIKGEVMVRFVRKEPESFHGASHNLMRELQNITEPVYHITMKNANMPLDKIINQMGLLYMEVLSCQQFNQTAGSYVVVTVMDRYNSEIETSVRLKSGVPTLTQVERSKNISNSLFAFFTEIPNPQCNVREICVGIVEQDDTILKVKCIDTHHQQSRDSTGSEDQVEAVITSQNASSPKFQWESPMAPRSGQLYPRSLPFADRSRNLSSQEIRSLTVSPRSSPGIAVGRNPSVHRLKFASGKLSTDSKPKRHRRKNLSFGIYETHL